jgi:hypothetical protein
VAVVPSIMRPGRRPLQVMTVTHKREPLRIVPAVLWDKRRTLPRYAEGFSELLAAHVQEAFARARPVQSKASPARSARRP